MTDWKQRASDLLAEFDACCKVYPKHNAVDLQIEKDTVAKFAYNLSTNRQWGTDNEIAEACHQLESRLKIYKEKIVVEVLQHGSV
jgi:predicted glycosyltransferase involved in capsule biosynthesis